MLKHIPQELIDLVIDHGDDISQLQTWSVVSRACLSSARRRLFHSIFIPPKKSSFGPPSIRAFMSTTPSLCTLVRELALGASKLESFTVTSGDPFHMAFPSFLAVLQQLPRLSVLLLENVVFVEPSEGEEYKYSSITTPRPSTRLEHLAFFKCRIDPICVLNIISRFEAISLLNISLPLYPLPGDPFATGTDPASLASGPTRVQSLRLFRVSFEDFWGLSEAIDLEHLESLGMTLNMESSDTEFLRACKNLKSLKAAIDPFHLVLPDVVDFMPFIDLSSCHNLSAFFVDFVDVYSISQRQLTYPVILRPLFESLATLPHFNHRNTDTLPLKLTICAYIFTSPLDTWEASDVHLALAQEGGWASLGQCILNLPEKSTAKVVISVRANPDSMPMRADIWRAFRDALDIGDEVGRVQLDCQWEIDKVS